MVNDKVSALTEQGSTRLIGDGADSPEHDESREADEPGAPGQVSTKQFVLPPRCDKKKCCCSCHSTKSSKWKGWGICYTPLAAIFRPCDQGNCTARFYHFALRIQLSWLGIPVAVLLSGEFVTGTAGYALRPSLQINKIVKATSPGFEILFMLDEHDLDIEKAKDRFRELFRSDSAVRTHVNPAGRTYLQELVYYGPWGQYGNKSGKQLEMLRFFLQELQITAGLDTNEYVSPHCSR